MTVVSQAELWRDANQRYLTASLDLLRHVLERAVGSVQDEQEGSDAELENALAEAASALPAPSAIDVLAGTLGLSGFERDLLLLCAGVELDSRLPGLCAAAHGDPRRTHASFGLGLTVLPDPHWSALTTGGALRYWRLLNPAPVGELAAAPLRIDERILHYLTGLSTLDERLASLVQELPPPSDLPASHAVVAEGVSGAWLRAEGSPDCPVVELVGPDQLGKLAIASRVSAELRVSGFLLNSADLPGQSELDPIARLLKREAMLAPIALVVDCTDVEDHGNRRDVLALLRKLGGRIIVLAREPLADLRVDTRRFDVGKPTRGEQLLLWKQQLGPASETLNGQVEEVVEQFQLDMLAVRAAGAEARAELDTNGPRDHLLWDACRSQARPQLDDLAQRIEPSADWQDLVLPLGQYRMLREVSAHVRFRSKVYEQWGFAQKSSRGLGISALFAGPSGTGKTMAAEVLAQDLRLDLYRIDLSQVVSKYIGETEKNLGRVFDGAENGGAILLFDEADALFGRRSEVKDSHDRYANLEVSFLLQRMEAYRGLAILTTNLLSSLDDAFMRRLRFVVQFPVPDEAHRAEIWRRVFPAGTPTEGLAFEQLARMSLTGGSIHNIGMNAAFLAADAGKAVMHQHVLQAARTEYAKRDRPLTKAERTGWAEEEDPWPGK